MIWYFGYRPVVVFKKGGIELEMNERGIAFLDEIFWNRNDKKFYWEPWVEDPEDGIKVIREVLEALGYKL